MPDVESPYVGLRPYQESHQEYFYGRNQEKRIVTNAVYAHPVTVFYGPSGVGKSSVLMAGVAPSLKKSKDKTVVVFREWQGEAFHTSLKESCIKALEASTEQEIDLDISLPLDDLLSLGTQQAGCFLFLVFDQFEEFFLYHTDTEQGLQFEKEFARCVNRDDVGTHFILSLREDGLSHLDRFKKRIPNLMASTVRLDHLNNLSAEEAIKEPLKIYSKNYPDKAVAVQEDLVSEIIAQVKTQKRFMGRSLSTGKGEAAESNGHIETPYLQLVLERLWKEEQKVNSHEMRLATFKTLDGAAGIVRAHLHDTMDSLSAEESRICAQIFDRLVTPSGSKIAIRLDDLARFSLKDSDKFSDDTIGKVKSLADKLAQKQILNRITPYAGEKENPSYEIVHDVLAQAILNWREEYLNIQSRDKAVKKRTKIFLGILFTLIVAGVLGGISWYQDFKETRPWGFMKNLTTGTVHEMKFGLFSIGRTTGYQNTVGLKTPSNFISRIHLLVSRDLLTVDVRSTNGTTVNAEFLPYGASRTLSDGDIVVLAGIAPFRFHAINYSDWKIRPPAKPKGAPIEGWALLVNGKTKEVHELKSKIYYVQQDRNGSFILNEKKVEGYLMTLQETNKFDSKKTYGSNIRIVDQQDNIFLDANYKKTDYEYPWVPLLAQKAIQTNGLVFRYRDTHFQIVPNVPDMEPAQ